MMWLAADRALWSTHHCACSGYCAATEVVGGRSFIIFGANKIDKQAGNRKFGLQAENTAIAAAV